MDRDATLAAKLALILPHLDERQRRLLLAAEAKVLGRGGVSRVAAVAGVSRPTIRKGLAELARPTLAAGRVRRVGGGRKRLSAKDPGLVGALDALVDPTTRGDPMSPLRWTCKSTRQLAHTLTLQGHPTSHRVVAELLHAQGYSLQANAKMLEGGQHPDRDAQFRHLNEQVEAFLAAGLPVISVDAKKKELIGRFKAVGREWQPQGQPEEVNVHDFENPALGKAIPYGIYDVGRNAGWVNVGHDHDTAPFAVESIRRWWQAAGRSAYPNADRILISADCGGSNGYRLRLWKWEFSRHGDRAHDHRMPLATRDEQVEQDRAPPILLHHHEHPRQAFGEPGGCRAVDRGDDYQDGSAGRGAARRRGLPHGTQGRRCRHGQLEDRAPHLPRRVELHAEPLTDW